MYLKQSLQAQWSGLGGVVGVTVAYITVCLFHMKDLLFELSNLSKESYFKKPQI